MKLKKVISVLAVLSLLTSSIGISAFASNRIEATENTDYTDTPTTEETITTEPTTEPETTDEMQQYEELKKNLMQEYENALSLNKEEYTEKSFENLENEINFTKTVLENWDKLYTAGDFALKSLKEAVLNLESYKDLLLDVIEKAEKISSEWYTDESFKVLTDAIEKGREAVEKGGITKDIANSLISDIQKAEENLYNIKDLLNQTIDEAKKKYDLVYEESSMAQFKTEIERIEKAFNDNLTSQEVKELIEAVSKAYSLLKPVIGDTDVSGDISISDATAVQNYISHIEVKIEQSVADVNFDDKITVSDVTNIQKYVAGLIDEFKQDPHLPDYDTEWNLVLVNYKYPIKSGYVPDMRVVDGRSIFTFDKRAADALEKMLDDCRAEGLEPLICSAYRTQELQEELFANKVAYYTNQGYSYEKAAELAKTSVAYPGTSEHQLGLAVDIVALDYQILDEGQLKTEEQQWLMKNCWKYGFILRYPTGKQDITGVIFEPWHYRYVGVEAAKEITEKGITLEEYLELD